MTMAITSNKPMLWLDVPTFPRFNFFEASFAEGNSKRRTQSQTGRTADR